MHKVTGALIPVNAELPKMPPINSAAFIVGPGLKDPTPRVTLDPLTLTDDQIHLIVAGAPPDKLALLMRIVDGLRAAQKEPAPPDSKAVPVLPPMPATALKQQKQQIGLCTTF